MPNFVSIDVRGVNKVIRKINDIDNFVRLDVPKLTFDAADRGAEFAARIAPRDTRALIQAIGTRLGSKRASSTNYVIVSRTPRNRDGRQRPYHAWMHGIGRYDTSNNNFRGKEPRYMFVTAEKLRKEFPELFRRRLSERINK